MTTEIAGKGFSIGELVKFGWNKMKENIWFFVGVLILAAIIPSIPSWISFFPGLNNPAIQFILQLISYILSLLMFLGLINISLKFSDNKKPTFSDLFNVYPLIVKYFIAHIIYTLIVIVGFFLLVFPGVIWGLRYGLFAYFIVEKGAGPIESLSLSAKATYGAKWDLLGLFFVNMMIILLGVFCLVIGLFAAIPVIMIAQALAYRKLIAQTSGLVSS